MAQECGFFNAQLVGENEYDRVYLAEQFAAYFASFIGNGIYGKSMQKLEVLAQNSPDMSIKVLSGEAWINGWWYRNTEEYTLPLDVADGVLSRIDVIVLRWGNQERDMWLYVIKGIASFNPITPSIRRDADYYDLQLAEVQISAGMIKVTQTQIKDTRLNNAVCGLVTGVVDQIDTTILYNQFESYFKDIKEKYEADYDKWTKEQKQAYLNFIAEKQLNYEQFVDKSEKDYTEYTKSKKDAFDLFVSQSENNYNEWTEEQKIEYQKWYDIHTTVWDNEFTQWFESIKDKLSDDIAGNLQLQVDENKERLSRLEHIASKRMLEVPIVTDDGKLITTSNGDVIEAVWFIDGNVEYEILDTVEQIDKNTAEGKIAGALALKNIKTNIVSSINQINNNLNNLNSNLNSIGKTTTIFNSEVELSKGTVITPSVDARKYKYFIIAMNWIMGPIVLKQWASEDSDKVSGYMVSNDGEGVTLRNIEFWINRDTGAITCKKFLRGVLTSNGFYIIDVENGKGVDLIGVDL